jgi:hypothetical protein
MANHSGLSAKLVLGLFLVLLGLGLADLFLTWKLMHVGDGQVLESNPVANWWLTTYGWGGMTVFKLAMLLVGGGLAGGIAYWRPRTSERLLFFVCGAQSAVVLYSLFLVRLAGALGTDPIPEIYWPDQTSDSFRPASPNALPENGLLLLLTQESVQTELQLSETQVKGVGDWATLRRELRRGPYRTDPDEWNSKVQQILAQEKALTEGLGPRQAERLRQISWQQRGPFAFTDPEVSEALQLTAAQKETIRTLVEEARPPRPPSPGAWGRGSDGPRRTEEGMNRTKDRLRAVLTADQTARWKEMLGEPFKGVVRVPFGGMPGPGRDGQRRGRP